MVLVLVCSMMWEKSRENLYRVSVIVQNSDDNQWAAFRYGLKMAAKDQEIEIFVVSTGAMTPEEEERIIRREIAHGADAVIVQPVPGADMEERLKKSKNRFRLCWWSIQLQKNGMILG